MCLILKPANDDVMHHTQHVERTGRNLEMAECSVVNILVLGDDGVGKTSLINTLISEKFPETVPCSVLEEVNMPSERYLDKVSLSIVDTSCRVLKSFSLYFSYLICSLAPG